MNFSCNNEGSNVSAIPGSYLLKRQIWTAPTANGGSFLYIYNSDHLVSRIERYQWGTYSVNGGQLQTFYDTSYYALEYAGNLCTKLTISDGGADGYIAYEYNDQNLPIKSTIYYSDNTVQSYSFYKYDGLNNLIEKIDSTDKVNFRYVFSYNESNNLTSVVNYILWPNPQRKVKYEWVAFDTKVNFIKAVNGLPITFRWNNNYHSYSSSSPNNILTEKYYVPVNIDEPFDSPNFTNYSYSYNEAGLPTTMSYGAWTVIFEYEKCR